MFAIACFVCYVLQITLGVGKPLVMIEANLDGYRQLLKARLVHQVCVVVGISLVKISVSLLLLRLVPKTAHVMVETYKWKIYTWSIRGLLGFVVLFTIVCVLTLVSNVHGGPISHCPQDGPILRSLPTMSAFLADHDSRCFSAAP